MGRTFWEYCNECKKYTNHEVVNVTKNSNTVTDSSGEVFEVGAEENELVKCLGCEFISLKKTYYDYEDFDFDTNRASSSSKYYPEKEEKFFRESVSLTMLPENVKNIFLESIKSFNHNNLLLSTIGLRATIEAICINKRIKTITIVKNNKTKKRNDLEVKIDALADKSFLTREQANILHGIRFVGNDAAHKIKISSVEDIRIGLGLIDHLLKTIYEFASKAKMMRVYKEKRMKKKLSAAKKQQLANIAQPVQTQQAQSQPIDQEQATGQVQQTQSRQQPQDKTSTNS